MHIPQHRRAGSLSWAVRDTLLRYVTVIAGGSFEIEGGVVTDAENRFRFPLDSASVEDDEWVLSFSGSVRFIAHHGFLDVRIVNPQVLLGPNGGVLATHTDDPGLPLMPLVELEPTTPVLERGRLLWEAVPSQLLPSGVELFGTVYEAGAEMASLRISVEDIDS